MTREKQYCCTITMTTDYPEGPALGEIDFIPNSVITQDGRTIITHLMGIRLFKVFMALQDAYEYHRFDEANSELVSFIKKYSRRMYGDSL